MNEAAIVDHYNGLALTAHNAGLVLSPDPKQGSFELKPGEYALPHTPTAYFTTLAELELYLRGYAQACRSYKGVCIVP